MKEMLKTREKKDMRGYLRYHIKMRVSVIFRAKLMPEKEGIRADWLQQRTTRRHSQELHLIARKMTENRIPGVIIRFDVSSETVYTYTVLKVRFMYVDFYS